MDVVELTKKLASISSISENEKVICDYVWALLVDLGFNPQKIPVDKDGYNILVKVGHPRVCLTGHLDTVPPFLVVKDDKERLYGRGVCDMKGAVAAMIMSAAKAKEKRLSNFGLLFTVGEETNFRGALKCTDILKNLGFMIVGEPTDLEVVDGHFGVLEIKLVAKGKKAHSSQPEMGVNAIDKLLFALNAIKLLKIHPQSSLNIGVIKGGTAVNIVPDEATAEISFRLSPNDNYDYLAEIKRRVGSKVEIQGGLMVRIVHCPVPKELSFLKIKGTVRYMTELSVYKNGVVLGPGNISVAHTDNEFINKEELQKAVEIYGQIIENYCS